MEEVVSGLTSDLPDLPIGVEPNATNVLDLKRLKGAGASELKINVQSANREIFESVCPNLDYDLIWQMLEEGPGIFGENRVCSNVLVGLGESDVAVLDTCRRLARIGVLANLRVLRVGDHNRPRLETLVDLNPVSPDRMLGLASSIAGIFKLHGLDPGNFRTMCFACGCCDITPGSDL
jgi:biotin synthase-related radical SAM superfamily protein